MTPASLNPFRPTRWEHHGDGRPLIWFTETAEMLAADKSTYVYGSRGSGKTTLLKGICWEDLCHNHSLRLQRKLADFSSVGIYIRFPDHISGSMSFMDWASVFPNVKDAEYEFHRFFSAAIEFICLERILDACHNLRLIGSLKFDAGQELQLVDDFVSEYAEVETVFGSRPKTFVELARALRLFTRKMNQACGRGDIAQFVQTLPAREPNQMLTYLAERVSAAVKLITAVGERTIGFKFCLDDCEVLNPLQRKSLNSLVRLSRAPCSWVISSVGGGRDDSETFIASQPLTDADRRVISLDGRDNADFQQLCQSVVSLRLLFSVPEGSRSAVTQEDVANFFDLGQRLGRRDVNDMMAMMIRKSGRPLARTVRHGAEQLLTLMKNRQKKLSTRYDLEVGRLPLYEAYVLMLWRGREESFKTSIDVEDVEKLSAFVDGFGQSGFDAWLRRKQRGAFLHFATSVGTRRLPLAGENVIVSLADGSIRDFLEIMGEIYEAYVIDHRWDPKESTNLSRFANSRTPISGDIQTTGIYSASQAYYEGISHRAEIDTDVISRLIAGLGNYTSLLQTNSADPKTLSTTERGVFSVDYSTVLGSGGLTDEGRFVHSAIRQAELAGYLRPVELRRFASASVDGQFRSIAFRLHRRFAPQFRFSFRGAYEGVSLDPKDIAILCAGDSGLTPRIWAENMAGRSQRTTDAQLEFFSSEVPSDD
jgi:hypothetical protein